MGNEVAALINSSPIQKYPHSPRKRRRASFDSPKFHPASLVECSSYKHPRSIHTPPPSSKHFKPTNHPEPQLDTKHRCAGPHICARNLVIGSSQQVPRRGRWLPV